MFPVNWEEDVLKIIDVTAMQKIVFTCFGADKCCSEDCKPCTDFHHVIELLMHMSETSAARRTAFVSSVEGCLRKRGNGYSGSTKIKATYFDLLLWL